LKAPKGNSLRFSIDSVFEDERLGYIYKYGLFEEEEDHPYKLNHPPYYIF
jgi:hypothetical protein